MLRLAFALCLFSSAALAQSPPWRSTTAGGIASGTIATTSTFQRVFTPSNRAGCTIQNQGTNSMRVTEGVGQAGSTTANSIIVTAGSTYSCVSPGASLTGEVDITGTAGDAYYAAQY